MIINKKLEKFIGINIIFLLVFIITSIPAIAQAQPTARIAINYEGLNPFADFDPVVQDELKCSYWTPNPLLEGHYHFCIEHNAAWNIQPENIDVYVFDSAELNFAHVDPIIEKKTVGKTYFRISPEHVDQIAGPWSFPEYFVRVYLSYNGVEQPIDPTDPNMTYRRFEINVRPVYIYDYTILPMPDTTIYNFFNAYINANDLNTDGLYAFMDDITYPNNEVMGVLETMAFADESNMVIEVPGTLAEGTYDLRFRTATTGARHERPMTFDNVTMAEFMDPNNQRNAITDYGVSKDCDDPDGPSFDIRLPMDLNDSNKAHYKVWYGTETLKIAAIHPNMGDDDIIELDRAWILANTDITDHTWNNLPEKLMVEYNDGLGKHFYAGVEDGVGPTLMSVQIDTDTNKTTFVFSSPLDPAFPADADDFEIWNGLGSVSTLDFTSFTIAGNEVIAGAALVDGDRVEMAADNGIKDLNGNQAEVSCDYEVAHTVRKIVGCAATHYFRDSGNWFILVEFSEEMMKNNADPTNTAEDPNLYVVSFPEPLDPNNAEEVVPDAAGFQPGGILFPGGGWLQKTVRLLVNHPTTDTSPSNMPTVTIKPVTDASGSVHPLGRTGGDFVGPPYSKLADDMVGPFIVKAWYMIQGECGKTSAELLADDKDSHMLMVEWSEPLDQSSVNLMGRDWLAFNPIGPDWNNYDVPFGLDWSKHKDGRVLEISLGTSGNGASEIIFQDDPALDPNISIVDVKLDDFLDVLGNDATQANNVEIKIANKTIPWIERAATHDVDKDGMVDTIVLTWNRDITQTPAVADPNVSDMVDNTTLNPSREITQIESQYMVPGKFTRIHVTESGVFDTDYTGTLCLFLDPNNYFKDLYGNMRDFPHCDCPVLDHSPAIIHKVCIWYGAVAGTFEVEVFFSEPVKDPDPAISPDQYFVVDAGSNYQWLNTDGSDEVLNFMVDNLSAPYTFVLGPVPIEDYAGNKTVNNPTNIQGPSVKHDYWAYPEIPPFNHSDPAISGPIISDASMDLEGYIYWDAEGKQPLSECDPQLCAPFCHQECGAIVLAFRHGDLFDPNTCLLTIDPARCRGATQLRRCDGYYAIHIYGQTCGDCDEGEAIILVVVPNPCNVSWPIDATDPQFQDDFYIMTNTIPDDTGFYVEWVDSRFVKQPLFNMYLARQEKIYLRTGWNLISTTIDKTYFDMDGAPTTGGVVTSGTPLLNSNGVATADLVPMNDIEQVYFTITPPAPCFGWTKSCTYDAVHYANGGFVLDYPSTDEDRNLPENQIAFFGAGNGYFIHMANAGLLVVLGDSVLSRDHQPYTKALNTGWNIAGYWSDWLRMVATGPSISKFKKGDFSSAITFPLTPGVNVDSVFLTPDQIYIGAGATQLRTYVNINHVAPSFKDIGVRVWDAGYETFDFRYIGPGMAAWVYATTSPLQFDE
jgi:hypothetical protein